MPSDETKRLLKAAILGESGGHAALDAHLAKLEAIAHAALDAVMHSHMAACDCGVCAAIRAYGAK